MNSIITYFGKMYNDTKYSLKEVFGVKNRFLLNVCLLVSLLGGVMNVQPSVAQEPEKAYYTVTFLVENPSDGTTTTHSQMLRMVGADETIGTIPQDPFCAGQTFKKWVLESGEVVTEDTKVSSDMVVYAVFENVKLYEISVDYYYIDCSNGNSEYVFDKTVYLVDGDKIKASPLSIVSPSETPVPDKVKNCTQNASSNIFYPEQQTVTISKSNLDPENRTITRKVKYVPASATYQCVYKLKDLNGSGYGTTLSTTTEYAVLNSFVTPQIKNFTGAVFDKVQGVTPVKITQSSGQVITILYDRANYLLTFDTQGGSAVGAIPAQYGETVNLPSNPTREGYDFDGWYKEPSYANKVTTSIDIEGNTTLYAKWKGKTVNYTVVYVKEKYDNATGTTSYVYDNSATKTGMVGTKVVASDLSNLPKAGTGYKIDTEKNKASEVTIAADGSSVLMVYYTLIRYTLVFNANGGTITINGHNYTNSNYKIEDVVLGQDISDVWPTSQETKKGNSPLHGWTRNGSSTTYATKRFELTDDMLYNPGTSTTTTYTASYDSGTTVNVEYWIQNPDGNGYTKSDKYSQNGVIISGGSFSAKTLDGYTNVSTPTGYSSTADVCIDVFSENNNGDYVRDDSKSVSGVDYDESEGHYYRKRQVQTKKVCDNTRCNKYHYECDGADCDAQRYSKSEKCVKTYRFYYTRNTFKITYYDGDQKLKEETVRYGADITGSKYTNAPSKPSGKDDYTWCGWKADSKLSVDYQFSTMPNNNVSLYACWKAPEYTVTFYANYPDATPEPYKTEKVEKNKKVQGIEAPTREHYSFLGWFTEADDETDGCRMFSTSEQITQNLELYAHWNLIPLKYTVRYLEKGTNKELFTSKVVESVLFEYQESITETALSIASYIPEQASKSIKLDYENNVITFYYQKKPDNNYYTVNYVLKDYPSIQVHEPKKDVEINGSMASVTEMAESIDRTWMEKFTSDDNILSATYYPLENTKALSLSIDKAANVINFYYVSYQTSKFTIQWLDMCDNPIPGKQTKTEATKVGASLILETNLNGYTYNHTWDNKSKDDSQKTHFDVLETGNILVKLYFQKNLTLTAQNKNKVYDGNPLVSEGVEDLIVTGLTGSDAITSVEYDGTITNVIDNVQKTTPKNAKVSSGCDDYYKIEYVSGELSIDPQEITININSGAPKYTYDGIEHTSELSVEGNIGSYLYDEEHGDEIRAQLTAKTLKKTDAGPVDNNYKYVLELDEHSINFPKDDNYEIINVNIKNLELTIRPAPLTVTTSSAVKAYDGTPLTNAEITVDGFVNGETATFATTGSQTSPGVSDNTYSLTFNKTAKEGNYYVEEENLGQLEVFSIDCKDYGFLVYEGEPIEFPTPLPLNGSTIDEITIEGTTLLTISDDKTKVSGVLPCGQTIVTFKAKKGTAEFTCESTIVVVRKVDPCNSK